MSRDFKEIAKKALEEVKRKLKSTEKLLRK